MFYRVGSSLAGEEARVPSGPRVACVLPCRGPSAQARSGSGPVCPTVWARPWQSPRGLLVSAQGQATGLWVPATWQAWLDQTWLWVERNTPVAPRGFGQCSEGPVFKMGDRAGTAGG